jgi:hypothetical protein
VKRCPTCGQPETAAVAAALRSVLLPVRVGDPVEHCARCGARIPRRLVLWLARNRGAVQ